MKHAIWILIVALAFMAGCVKTAKEEPKGIMFKDDVAFLKQHTQPVVLSGADGRAKVAVNPDLQGRVMTSTAAGDDGLSFGWINRELLASKQNNAHMNAFGGEDRFWLGPEGGQFSIFFKKERAVQSRQLVHPAADQRRSLRHRPRAARRNHVQEGNAPGQLFRDRV